MPQPEVSYAVKALTPFIGAIIVDLIEDDDGFLGIVIEQENKLTTLWVQQDSEGNGPGWIFPDPYKEDENAEGN